MEQTFMQIPKPVTKYMELKPNGKIRYLTEDGFNRSKGNVLYFDEKSNQWVILDKSKSIPMILMLVR